MKKLNIYMLLLAGSLCWTGCGDDRDVNRFFRTNQRVDLNTPAQANEVYDLKNSFFH